MERTEAIRGAYRMTGGNSFYDGHDHLLYCNCCFIVCCLPQW